MGSAERVPEIGKYHLIAELARGGMGIIYLAVAHGPGGFNKLLVVKELKPELADDGNFVAMFLDEARVAARMTHPNIVQTNEVGSEGGRPFIVMEFLDGRTLQRVVRRLADRGGLPLGAQVRVIAEALLGLHYAHELRGFDGQPLGVVHRDVSPHNIFITFDGQVKLVDFGIAKALDSSLETKSGVLKGRVAYMAPEQACGEKVDRRADIYSVGVMIWEAAAKRRLWSKMGDVEILARLLREDPPRLSSVVPDAPPELDAICAKAMHRSRDERYETAADLHDDLYAFLLRRPDAMSMREIGQLIGEAFASERDRMRALIEDTLVSLRNGGGSEGKIPALDVHITGTPSGPRDGPSSESSANVSSQLVLIPPSKRPSGLASALTDSKPSGVRIGKGSKGRKLAIAGSAVGIAAAVAVVGAMAMRGGESGGGGQGQALAPLPSTASAPAPTAPIAPAPELVDVTIRISPASAHIKLDGAIVGNPFHARYPKDDRAHTVSASADGYDSKSMAVSFAQNVDVEMDLERHAAPTYVVVAPPPRGGKRASAPAGTSDVTPPPQPQTPTPEVSPTGGHAPLRPIDTSNPYGN